MFGSVFHMRPKAGQEDALMQMENEWLRERGSNIRGFVTSYIVKPEKNPGEIIGVAIFEDRESYYANAEDPEQDRWYRRMREMLEDDPIWEDGEIMQTSVSEESPSVHESTEYPQSAGA